MANESGGVRRTTPQERTDSSVGYQVITPNETKRSAIQNQARKGLEAYNQRVAANRRRTIHVGGTIGGREVTLDNARKQQQRENSRTLANAHRRFRDAQTREREREEAEDQRKKMEARNMAQANVEREQQRQRKAEQEHAGRKIAWVNKLDLPSSEDRTGLEVGYAMSKTTSQQQSDNSGSLANAHRRFRDAQTQERKREEAENQRKKMEARNKAQANEEREQQRQRKLEQEHAGQKAAWINSLDQLRREDRTGQQGVGDAMLNKTSQQQLDNSNTLAKAHCRAREARDRERQREETEIQRMKMEARAKARENEDLEQRRAEQKHIRDRAAWLDKVDPPKERRNIEKEHDRVLVLDDDIDMTPQGDVGYNTGYSHQGSLDELSLIFPEFSDEVLSEFLDSCGGDVETAKQLLMATN